MGKNIKGGKNYKKQKKNPVKDRELIFREGDQSYARIIKQLGDGRFECQVFDSNSDLKVIGKICGSMRKRIWIQIGNIVLVSGRSFDSSNCDIIHKYTDEEAQSLKDYDEIPSNVNLMATSIELSGENIKYDNDDNIMFEFENI